MTRAEVPVTGVMAELRSLIEAEGGLLAEALRPAVDDPLARDLPMHDPESLEVFASLVAGGQRTSKDPRGYALVVESILEGYLLHYRHGRIVANPDPDLCLLAGDHLYAFGLARLASIGDLEAVDELSDLISLCAHAHALAGESEETGPWGLTAALWALSVLAVADGSWPGQRNGKRITPKDGSTDAGRLLGIARDRAQELGLVPRLEHALIAFQRRVEGQLSTT